MPRLLTVTVFGMVLGVLIALSPGGAARGDGLGTWIKFLFPPQAGWNSACLSCGWHDGGCVGTPPPGPALDFPGTCTGSHEVYLRAFGYLPSGSPDTYVGYAYHYVPAGTICKEVDAIIRDVHGNLLQTMRYVHTENPDGQTVYLYASGAGYPNQQPFAEMTTMDNQACINQHWWQPPPDDGVHLHEAHDGTGANSIVFLRDGGDCTPGDRYPCGPQSWPYPTRNPQDWADWARIFCFDDTDCDGWTDGQESYVGTDSWDACPDSSTDPAWPLDINNDRVVNIVGDVLRYVGRMNATPGSSNWWQRLNLNGDGLINVLGDVMLYRGKINSGCIN